ncbi:hypothetical protein [Saccharopolyspora pogona]|uniref:hypothetical protein n=1 Tax=Saccharopolyspora pogona TaxID=333966 RepID=UPI001686736D|nr:hypothetical protein [Saccharopolyspora pogona]
MASPELVVAPPPDRRPARLRTALHVLGELLIAAELVLLVAVAVALLLFVVFPLPGTWASAPPFRAVVKAPV